jgi:hypothetical protein
MTVMRDPNADDKRRDAMAIAAAPYLHPKLSLRRCKTKQRLGKTGRR